ncbi:phytanoyl-CoA dioxygenase [Larkinella terrae]|uniref:Phytanoyl-CoA dioxygenase n=2 Tax=Larkinella terrae TaxID=2025311 RepID=A0A7K0EI84_9BACT|nr:phytanoyl-CoA dioxygenase [Larkinella terrae]
MAVATSQSAENYSMNLPWIESPFFRSELKKANLSPEMERIVTQFAEEGFVVFDPEIDESILDQALEQLEPKHLAVKDDRIQDAWKDVEAVKQIATAPKVLDVLRMLYRREPIPFQTLNFKLGTQQRTHSDSMHFHSIPQRFMCGVWVALEDVRNDNGPLHYYPGSHKLPFYDLSDIGIRATSAKTLNEAYSKTYPKYADFLSDMIEAQDLKKAILNMKKGKALIWAANLLHGGEQIITPGSTRYSQVSHYFFEDCVYYTPLQSDMPLDKLYLRQITNIITGEKVANKYIDAYINQENEGYAMRITVPSAFRRIGGMILKPFRKLLGR